MPKSFLHKDRNAKRNEEEGDTDVGLCFMTVCFPRRKGNSEKQMMWQKGSLNMKTFRKRKIWISSLLALSLLINVLSASAEGADNHSESTTTETEQNYVESPIVNEDVSKRGENEKHFLCEDGSYIAVAYADAVHEKNEQDEAAYFA